MAYSTSSPRAVGGWICLQSIAHIRLLGGGLNAGRMKEYGIFKALASIRGHGIVSVNSSTVEAKKGESL
jgi:hypothetical protein